MGKELMEDNVRDKEQEDVKEPNKKDKKKRFRRTTIEKSYYICTLKIDHY